MYTTYIHACCYLWNFCFNNSIYKKRQFFIYGLGLKLMDILYCIFFFFNNFRFLRIYFLINEK